MARPLRLEYPGAVYHITSRGNQGNIVFRNDEHREEFLEIVAATGRRYNWLCHAYCLMDNHYHLVVETPDGNLSKAMRQVNAVYTQYFNRKERTAGHLFQGRYKAFLIEKDSYLLAVIRYVMLNPVRAGLVSSPEKYLWSSYRALCGVDQPHPCLTASWVLGMFDTHPDVAVRKFASFVADGTSVDNPFLQIKGQVILGSDSFHEKIKPVLEGKATQSEIPATQRMLGRPELPALLGSTGKKDRNVLIGEAVERWGYSQKVVADFLGLHYSSISRILKGKVPAAAPVIVVQATDKVLSPKLSKYRTSSEKTTAAKKQQDVQPAADQLSLF